MRPPKTGLRLLVRAPHCAGALLLVAVTLLFGACGEKESKTPDWSKEGKTPAKTDSAPDPSSPAPTPSSDSDPGSGAPTPAPVPSATDSPSGPAPQPDRSSELRFLAYNLKNYLTMTRYVNGERQDTRKSDSEIAALVRIIVSTEPDVLGLCEVGTREDLADLQKRLTEAGLALTHSEHAGGVDDTRHLALLSRFPIVATDSQGAGGSLTYNSVDLEGNPRQFAMQRGILDASVEAGGKTFRFLGVHLKSKREIPEGHQDLMRRNEAWLLRQHASRILQSAPGTLLCVYGDFNDTRRESPVRSISGDAKSDLYLEPLSHKDSRGEVWTHYWDYQHVYSRFDYILASRALRPLFDQKQSRIIDDPAWFDASDHRPLLAIFALDRN